MANFLLLWYFTKAKPQVLYIKNQYGDIYKRKSWKTPLCLGFLLIAAIGNLQQHLLSNNQWFIAKATQPIVSQIYQKKLRQTSTKCVKVEILNKTTENSYQATATLNNGKKVSISIKIQGEQIFVNLGPKALLAESAQPVVSQIYQKNLGQTSVKCVKVEILGKTIENVYRAIATLNNGEKVSISIKIQGKRIFVCLD